MKMPVRLIGFLLFVLCAGARADDAPPFVVTTTADSGPGSLRAAITAANGASQECEKQTINFNIPGDGVQTIHLLSALPSIEMWTILNGYSQHGSSQNTLSDGDNAVITIELDGTSAGSSNGLSLVGIGLNVECPANGSIVSGLVINNFALAGIDVTASPCHNGCFAVGSVRIEGSFIGTDTTGKIARPNGVGIHFGTNSVSNIVGDELLVYGGGNPDPYPFLRNVISGNLSDGIRLDSTDTTLPSSAHHIRGNYIGVDATGAKALANGRYGVLADVGTSSEGIHNNIIGAHSTDGVRIVGGQTIGIQYNAIGVGVGGVALPNAGDGIHVSGGANAVTVTDPYPGFSGFASIAHNGGAGLYVEDGSTVDVVRGSFGSNGGLGIDLAPRGPNPNNAVNPGTGPNQSLNAPMLLTATYNSATSPPAVVTGELDTAANANVEIHFYISKMCDPSGFGEGEGESYVINSVKADGTGYATFSQSGYFQSGQAVTALTRTFVADEPEIVVSEFSNCIVVGDNIFANGFGP